MSCCVGFMSLSPKVFGYSSRCIQKSRKFTDETGANHDGEERVGLKQIFNRSRKRTEHRIIAVGESFKSNFSDKLSYKSGDDRNDRSNEKHNVIPLLMGHPYL